MRAVGGSEAAPAFQRLFMHDPRIGHRLRPGAEHALHDAASSPPTSRINAAGVRGAGTRPEGARRTAHRRPRRLAGARRSR